MKSSEGIAHVRCGDGQSFSSSQRSVDPAAVPADSATRVNHLNGSAGGGLNGGYLLNNTTVHDDAAIDQLYGEAGNDWFFYTRQRQLQGQAE